MGCLSKTDQKIETVYSFLSFSLKFSVFLPFTLCLPPNSNFFFLFSTQDQMAPQTLSFPQGRRRQLTLTPARPQWTQGQRGDLRTLEGQSLPGSPSLRTAHPQGQWQQLVLTSMR